MWNKLNFFLFLSGFFSLKNVLSLSFSLPLKNPSRRHVGKRAERKREQARRNRLVSLCNVVISMAIRRRHVTF